MNNSDLKDLRSFANIRAFSGHEDCFVYADGNSYRFAPAPESAEEMGKLIYAPGQENN
jgi:hypothetical protein